MHESKPYDVYAKLEDPLGVLSVNVGWWESRDPTASVPQPEVRSAANKAMDAIDEMLTALHAIRQRLTGEIRVHDDLAVRRSEELLERLRGERDEQPAF